MSTSKQADSSSLSRGGLRSPNQEKGRSQYQPQGDNLGAGHTQPEHRSSLITPEKFHKKAHNPG